MTQVVCLMGSGSAQPQRGASQPIGVVSGYAILKWDPDIPKKVASSRWGVLINRHGLPSLTEAEQVILEPQTCLLAFGAFAFFLGGIQQPIAVRIQDNVDTHCVIFNHLPSQYRST